MIRNDSGMPLATALKHLEGRSVTITYGGISIMVEQAALDDAKKHVAGYTLEGCSRVMASVGRALRRALPKMASGEFSKRTADNFHADIILWSALKARSAQ